MVNRPDSALCDILESKLGQSAQNRPSQSYVDIDHVRRHEVSLPAGVCGYDSCRRSCLLPQPSPRSRSNDATNPFTTPISERHESSPNVYGVLRATRRIAPVAERLIVGVPRRVEFVVFAYPSLFAGGLLVSVFELTRSSTHLLVAGTLFRRDRDSISVHDWLSCSVPGCPVAGYVSLEIIRAC